MKILLCGGGTGGHITPILAIAHEIKLSQPDAYIIYVGEHGSKFGYLTDKSSSIDEVRRVYAGKFRRYHNQSWAKRLLDFKTNFFNIRDFFYVVIGIFQSIFLIGKLNPDVVFLKGGYVGLPIGLAAAFRKIPFITHDSDAIPSLTNKIVSKWAVYNATGVKEGLYPYKEDKKRFVGVPVAPEYINITKATKLEYRKKLNIPESAKILVVTGGSLGAIRLNVAVSKIISQLFEQINDLFVIHQAGKGKNNIYGVYTNPNLIIKEFINDMYLYTGAADVVLTRSGANTISELAVQGKATIIVPNPQLTGGHQIKNAQALADKNAAIVISEKELTDRPEVLVRNIASIMNDPALEEKLSNNLHVEAVPNSASVIAMLLLSIGK